jgi:phosphoribosylanthranilate isomerase
MNIFVKICGITSSNDANLAAEFGADAIGLNQYKQSPRYVNESGLINIKENLDNNILIVPVFVDPNVQEVHRFIDIFPNSILQFHGNESLKFCKQFDRPFIKSINQKEFTNIVDTTKEYISADYFLLDSGTEDLHGGTGEIFDWKKIPVNLNNLIIAGGLNSNNILSLLDYFIPFGVDVCSGVESKKGVKDPFIMKEFIELIKNYER